MTYNGDENIQLELPIQEKTVWNNNSEHSLFCLVLKRPLRQMSSAKQNTRDFSGNDVINKNYSYVLGGFCRKLKVKCSFSLRRNGYLNIDSCMLYTMAAERKNSS